MAAPDYFARKPSFNPSRSALPPPSPHTPLLTRSLSSQLGSPGASYRAEEDGLIYEIGSRCLRAGVAGDSAPRCIVPFGPDHDRRLNHFATPISPCTSESDWAKDWELWDLDVRNINLGLIEDRIERAVRNAHANHLMLDQRPRKLFLILPSNLPHPLISAALRVVFDAFQSATVQLWATPVLCAVSAGLRSALVIDIGWHETTVTALYEYRELLHRKSTRASKLLTQKMSETLRKHASSSDTITFDVAEDVTTRMAWCRNTGRQPSSESVSLPLGSSTSQVPFDHLAYPVEDAFFSDPLLLEQSDDHDLPIHLLAYRCLLSLALDVRAICVSRIIITGGASEIPGLKSRILQEVEVLVNTKGWDPVMNYGSATAKREQVAQERSMTLPIRAKASDINDSDGPGASTSHEQSLARDAPQERDEVMEKLQRDVAKRGTTIKGVVRGIESLGAWAGASLVASLKVDAAFEIKRDDFLKHGLGSLGHAF